MNQRMWGIKTMTNREWLIKEMQNMSDEELAGFFFDELGIYKEIRKTTSDSEIHHPEYIDMWLKAEHKEKPKLSEAERVILEILPEGYKSIARDKDNTLKIGKKNLKKAVQGYWFGENVDSYTVLEPFEHLFQFIKWEDAEPYEIAELLKEE